jgi:hypothetical protein
MHAYGAPDAWVTFWGSPGEARAAFEALRQTTRGGEPRRVLGAKDGETYEEWLARIAREAKARWNNDETEADDEPDEDAAPWGAGR